MKTKRIILFSFISSLLTFTINCAPNPDQLIEMVTPIVYEISKITDKYNRQDGNVKINLNYENIHFQKHSHFPSGEMNITAKSSNLNNDEYKMIFRFNGSYKSSCTLIYPNGKKKNYEINLAEKSIIKGKTLLLDDHIISLSKKITSDIPNKSLQKLAVFPFPTLDKRYTLLGDYISENIITELSNNKIRVVERGLLKELLKEYDLNQTGLIIYSQDAIDKVIQVTGATAIVTGTISEINEEIVLNSRIISKNGEVIITAKEIIKGYLIPSNYLKKRY